MQAGVGFEDYHPAAPSTLYVASLLTVFLQGTLELQSISCKQRDSTEYRFSVLRRHFGLLESPIQVLRNRYDFPCQNTQKLKQAKVTLRPCEGAQRSNKKRTVWGLFVEISGAVVVISTF